jgi:hypothetical protein
VYAEAEDVLVPDRSRDWLAAAHAAVEDRRDLVDRFDFDAKAAARLRDRADVRGRQERLRSQEALRLGASKLRTRLPHLERHEATDDAVASRSVVEADRARDPAPHLHVAAERRPLGSHDNGANGVAVARHSQRRCVGADRGL